MLNFSRALIFSILYIALCVTVNFVLQVARRKEKEAAAAQKEANIALSKQLGLGAASMNIEDKYKFMITATNTKREGAADSAWDD